MQGSAHVGAPGYIQKGQLPRINPVQKVGAVFLFLAMLLCGIGGALAGYCVLDSYGFCYYPDAGVGWGMVGLGIILFIVAAVLLLTGRKRVATGGPLVGATPQSYAPPVVAPAYPTPQPVPLPPPGPEALGQFCGICGQPAVFIAQYGRFYCYACARYT
jgi:hypothetical protein